jgi:hypothetical protein
VRHRKHLPLSTKLRAALHCLGLDPDSVEWHHEPPLAMRPLDPETGDTIPAELDWRHLVPLSREDHKVQTFGTAAPLSGDVSKISKLKRVEKKAAAFRERLMAKTAGESQPKKSRFPSRPFRSS